MGDRNGVPRGRISSSSSSVATRGRKRRPLPKFRPRSTTRPIRSTRAGLPVRLDDRSDPIDPRDPDRPEPPFGLAELPHTRRSQPAGRQTS